MANPVVCTPIAFDRRVAAKKEQKTPDQRSSCKPIARPAARANATFCGDGARLCIMSANRLRAAAVVTPRNISHGSLPSVQRSPAILVATAVPNPAASRA